MKVPKEFFSSMQEPGGMTEVVENAASSLSQMESAYRLMVVTLYQAAQLDIDKAFLVRTEMMLSRMQDVKTEISRAVTYLQKIVESSD